MGDAQSLICQSNSFSGNTGLKPDVIFRLRYGPSTYRGSNSKNYARASDHNDRANNVCALLRQRRLLRR